MKNLILFTALAVITSLMSCKDDVIDFDYDPGLIHYDGPNANAPFLPAGTTEAAARFPARVLELYEGKQIEEIELFIYDAPEQVELLLYGTGDNDSPGSVLIQRSLTGLLNPNGWNTIDLGTPFAIPSSGDLWISLRVTNPEAIQVIGCDAGPTREGGDWLYQSNDGQWLTFRERSPDNINWNIRAVIF